jgi:hypothetical protein
MHHSAVHMPPSLQLGGEKINEVGSEILFELLIGESGFGRVFDAPPRQTFRILPAKMGADIRSHPTVDEIDRFANHLSSRFSTQSVGCAREADEPQQKTHQRGKRCTA